ncbi:coenzyme F420-0:L-glutamate ligase [Desertimonas flava]|uniref:coenzyme F420-0:L-glutamate ligase n=1 Tax=Desertimonas flava TaxID=2064846 RepID=UPI000E346C58|nr:coenzyme F420-0:L-glutamate ligase [Desertimonas flava]
MASTQASSIQVFGVGGLPEIAAGDDLSAMITAATDLHDGDVVIVTSKVVSKAEGAVIDLAGVHPSPFAAAWAEQWDKDPRVVEVVLAESRRVVRMSGPVLITETHHGFICANSGVDQSSSGGAGRVVVLPKDPDGSARRLRDGFRSAGLDIAVIVSDTFGRPWREGQTDVAIGIAGMSPITSYIGQRDPHGHEFRVQELCVADELTAAAELVKGNVSRVPVAVVRGFDWEPDESATAQMLLRDPSRDLFR